MGGKFKEANSEKIEQRNPALHAANYTTPSSCLLLTIVSINLAPRKLFHFYTIV